MGFWLAKENPINNVDVFLFPEMQMTILLSFDYNEKVNQFHWFHQFHNNKSWFVSNLKKNSGALYYTIHPHLVISPT